MKATTTVYRRLNLMLRPLDEPIGEARPGGGLGIREMTPADIGAYLEMLPARRGVVEDRLRRGARCVLAWDEDRLVHAYWMASERVRVDYLEQDLRLPPDDVYLFDAFTRPSHRGRSLFHAVSVRLMETAREEGRRRAWFLTAPENVAGVSAVASLGSRRVGVVHYLRLGLYARRWSRVWTDAPTPTLEGSAAGG